MFRTRLLSQSQIPWPLAACINFCDTELDALDLARKADAGLLGDLDNWLGAEHRWRTDGVTERDIGSMSDERLPFDGGIDSVGFPTSLSIWPAFRPHSEDIGSLRRLLDLHSELDSSKARALVARLIEICVVGASMFIAPDETEFPISLDSSKVQAVLEDLPTGTSLPLHAIVNLLSGSDQEVMDFYKVANSRQVNFAVYDIRGIFHRDGLDRLQRAFVTAADGKFLVPLLGALAERGQLPSNIVGVGPPDSFEALDQKTASALIMLSQESWTTDRTDLLIGLVEGIARCKSPNGVYGKIINTLTENRSTGPWFDKFLIELGKLLLVDSYELKKRYVLLLRNALRRRTSRFADATKCEGFNLPTGIT